MLIDTHCHLDAPEFDADRDAVITAARQAGLGAIVVPAVFRRNWDTVQALAEREPDVWFALGLHPLYVNDAGPEDLEHLRQRVMAVRDHPRFVGIGEIGLDYFVPGLDPARQQAVFEAQVRLAAEFGLPVILHTRRSVDAVTKQLRRFRPPGGIAHAFNGSPQQAQHLIGLGMAIGFGGAAACRPRAWCWRPMRPTSRPPGSIWGATSRPSWRASPRCWQNCAGCHCRPWKN